MPSQKRVEPDIPQIFSTVNSLNSKYSVEYKDLQLPNLFFILELTK